MLEFVIRVDNEQNNCRIVGRVTADEEIDAIGTCEGDEDRYDLNFRRTGNA